MRFSIRFILFAVMPCLAALCAIWTLTSFPESPPAHRDVYLIFRVLFCLWFLIGWVFAVWLAMMFVAWRSRGAVSKREDVEPDENTKN